jgi:ABC-type transport system substrate-binding protein
VSWTRRRTLFGLSAAAGIGAAACARIAPVQSPAGANEPTGAAPTAAPPVASVPKRGGTFRNAGPVAVQHLDPHLATGVASLVGGLCYSRLFKYKADAPPSAVPIAVPDLVDSWEQPDDLTYLLRLRPNAQFHNLPPVHGRPPTAEDVVFSLNRLGTRGFPNASLLDAVARTEAVDRSTVRVTLSRPEADFVINLAATAAVIVPHEAVELKGDLRGGPVIGTGAFVADALDLAGTSTLVRNSAYFLAGKPYLDRYQFTPIPDSAALLAAFRAGNLEAVPATVLGVEDVAALARANPRFQIPTFRQQAGLELGMRVDRPPFRDLRVRRAVYKAVDAAAIIATAFGSGWLTVGVPVPDPGWLLPEVELRGRYQPDPDEARRLLQEAGFGNGLDLTMPFVATPAAYATAAELVIAQLREVDIRVSGKPLDFNAYNEQVQARGEFEIELGFPNPTQTADATLFGRYHSRGGRNHTGIDDEELDSLIERQTTLGRRPEERMKLILDIQRLILDREYFHLLRGIEGPAAYQPHVRDFYVGGPLSSEPDRFTHVWLDK